MKKLIVLLLLFTGTNLYSQQDTLFDVIRLNGTLSDFVTTEQLENYKVTIILDTEIIYLEEFAGNESYSIDLPYGFEYTVVYSSKEYASRRTLIDASDIPIANQKIYDLPCSLGLVKKQKGMKTKDISKMLSGIARYSPTKDSVEWFPNQKERIDKIISDRISVMK